MQTRLEITNSLSIPISEIQFQFARGGGPGGQNVNKVETRVELFFDILHSPSLTTTQRETLLYQLRSRVDAEGVLRITAQASRSQWSNRQDALRRFVELLQHALKPKKKRVKTKVSKASKEKRLESKKRRGETKRLRRFSDE